MKITPFTPALSVLQPWATALALGWKDVENRTWSTSYRGPLLIHASRRKSSTDHFGFFYTALEAGFAPDVIEPAIRYGAVVGIVELHDVVRDSRSPWAVDEAHHWLARNAIAFAEPVPARGALGLWRLGADTHDAVRFLLEQDPQDPRPR